LSVAAFALALATACTSNKPALEDGTFCARLENVASALPVGETWVMRLWSNKIGVFLDYTKGCDWSDSGEPAKEFCQWWFAHSANEFFELNINAAGKCLVGRDLLPPMPQTGSSGSRHVERPRWLGKGVVADLDYSMETSGEGKPGGFVEIRLARSR
jgi:hypothetical protein